MHRKCSVRALLAGGSQQAAWVGKPTLGGQYPVTDRAHVKSQCRWQWSRTGAQLTVSVPYMLAGYVNTVFPNVKLVLRTFPPFQFSLIPSDKIEV